MLDIALSLCQDVFTAETAREASLALHRRALTAGAISLQSRLYYRPIRPLTSVVHWTAGGFIVR